MNIIDDKGRLFGKINIIDFMVLLFILCLMPMFYFGYKIFNRKPKLLSEPTSIAPASTKWKTPEDWDWFVPDENKFKINNVTSNR